MTASVPQAASAQGKQAQDKQVDALFQAAWARHRVGDVAGAMAGYQQVLAVAPRHAEALHLLGVAEDARGAAARAVALIRQSLEINETAWAWCNLGMALMHLGDAKSAYGASARAVALSPGYVKALNNMGTALEALGRPQEAETVFRDVLSLEPNSTSGWSNLGTVLRLLRRHADSDHAYLQAVVHHPAMVLLRAALAQVPGLVVPQDLHLALPAAQIAHLADPVVEQVVAALVHQATTQPDAGRIGADGWATLGVALRQLARFKESELACRVAVTLAPNHALGLGNLAHALREQGRPDLGEVFIRRLVALQPSRHEPYSDLATMLLDMKRGHEALAVLDLALALAPGEADIRYHRSFALMLQGRWMEGWDEYAARFETRQGRIDHHAFAAPRWDGAPLQGRTILLHAEQGCGDTIQFCRYVPLVAQAGGRVVLEVQPGLVSLLAGLEGVAQLVAQGQEHPPHDVQCSLLSLPPIFGTTPQNVPYGRQPYLSPSTAAISRWKARFCPGAEDTSAPTSLRVGVVWAGNPLHLNDRRRSIPFSALEDLWAVPDVAWHSFQLGPRGQDAVAVSSAAPSGTITDLSAELTDWNETAAALSQMHAVVTVDTAVAHLAGALGVPVFMMLPFAPDWRWLRDGAQTPWYGSMRLMRQDADKSWMPVVAQVARALGDIARHHGD